ncbi:hypothetical protein VIGAN_01074100 [Vigna angularis var. angularis]|uniref:Uncharacterized protein n=1 Tax=Vigna angularis var. angularis TaxID=157739 RepID=A0A0S3QY82_PHAAN|nr:hypothetical protein VIGAN_01074100 [Vigna angularis var. angularis]
MSHNVLTTHGTNKLHSLLYSYVRNNTILIGSAVSGQTTISMGGATFKELLRIITLPNHYAQYFNFFNILAKVMRQIYQNILPQKLPRTIPFGKEMVWMKIMENKLSRDL